MLGCSPDHPELRVLKLNYQNVSPQAMQAVFEQRSGVRLIGVTAQPGTGAIDMLTSGEADLAFVENSTPFAPGVRAVLPVYKSVLHVLMSDDFLPGNVQQPLQGSRVYLANRSNAARTLIEVLSRRQHLQPGDFELLTEDPGSEADFIIYFGPLTSEVPPWYRPGYTLVAVNKLLRARGVDNNTALGPVAGQMTNSRIPALTYDIPGNTESLPTLAVDTLLVTRKDIPENLIYLVTETFIEQKPRLAAVAPSLFSHVTESFDAMELSFPLHRGARRYLERDEPNLLERYAESINLLVYLVFLLLTGGVALARWRAHGKKDRIDTFYRRVLGVRERAGAEDSKLLLQELRSLEEEAFSSLIDEKLAANESFRIFTDLMGRTRRELESISENQ
ncbi:MAG: TAXI family TRAP transporter solute-binding subunit [Halieaceae bacterium]